MIAVSERELKPGIFVPEVSELLPPPFDPAKWSGDDSKWPWAYPSCVRYGQFRFDTVPIRPARR